MACLPGLPIPDSQLTQHSALMLTALVFPALLFLPASLELREIDVQDFLPPMSTCQSHCRGRKGGEKAPGCCPLGKISQICEAEKAGSKLLRVIALKSVKAVPLTPGKQSMKRFVLIVRAELSKATVHVRTGGELSQPRPRTHQCV